jgi:hypothetical protein
MIENSLLILTTWLMVSFSNVSKTDANVIDLFDMDRDKSDGGWRNDVCCCSFVFDCRSGEHKFNVDVFIRFNLWCLFRSSLIEKLWNSLDGCDIISVNVISMDIILKRTYICYLYLIPSYVTMINRSLISICNLCSYFLSYIYALLKGASFNLCLGFLEKVHETKVHFPLKPCTLESHFDIKFVCSLNETNQFYKRIGRYRIGCWFLSNVIIHSPEYLFLYLL